MEKLSDIPKSKSNQLVPFSVGLISMLGMVLWLIGFFRISHEDRMAAGICMNGDERDE